ncbi:DUF4402 domain-containing protein [Streptomyces sp. NPDC047028]|uniref:DUF4402 domain-containing protein n=1 Tax=Streptomyces sp. NPDC047028 TaxID=3155793 RepID=UPI0033F3E942
MSDDQVSVGNEEIPFLEPAEDDDTSPQEVHATPVDHEAVARIVARLPAAPNTPQAILVYRQAASAPAASERTSPRVAEEKRPPVKLPMRDLRTHNIDALKRVPEGGSVSFSVQALPQDQGLAIILLNPPRQWPRELRTVARGKITKTQKGKRLGRNRGELQIEVTGSVTDSQISQLLNFTKKKQTFTRRPLQGADEGGRLAEVKDGVPAEREEKMLSADPTAERDFVSSVGSLLVHVAAVRETVKAMEPEELESLRQEVSAYERRVALLRAWLRHGVDPQESETPDMEQLKGAVDWTQELIREHGEDVERLKRTAESPAWGKLAEYEGDFARALRGYQTAVHGRMTTEARRQQTAFTSAVGEIRGWQKGQGRAREMSELLRQAAVALEEYQAPGPREVKGAKSSVRNELVVIGHGVYKPNQQTFVPDGCEIRTLTEEDSFVAIGMGVEAAVGELKAVRTYRPKEMIPNLSLSAGNPNETVRLNRFLESTSRPILRKVILVGSVPAVAKASDPPGAPPGPVTLESGITLCNGYGATCDRSTGVHHCTGLLARLTGTVILTACTAPMGWSSDPSFVAKRETPRTFTDLETKETATAGLKPWEADQIYAHPELGRTLAPAKNWVKIFQRGATEGEGNAWLLLSEERRSALDVAQPEIGILLQRPENLWITAPGVEHPFQRETPRRRGASAWRARTQAEFDALSGSSGDGEIHVVDTRGETLRVSRTGTHSVFVYGAPGAVTISVSGGNVEVEASATVTSVSGGVVSTSGTARVGSVTGGSVFAKGSSVVDTVSGGTVSANGAATVTTVNDGATVLLDENARVTTVNGGTVTADGSSRVDTVEGGTVTARESATVAVLNGGTVNLSESATITTTNGGTTHRTD